MPISIALPATSLEWEQEYTSPVAMTSPASTPNTNISGSNVSLGFVGQRPGMARNTTLESNATNPGILRGWGAIGGGGTINRWEERHGRPAARSSSTAAVVGDGATPFGWFPSLGAASGIAAGSRQVPSSLVGVFTWNLSWNMGGAVPPWADDLVGVFFLPFVSTIDIRQVPGNATADVGGFGVFVNNDGAGGSQYEYVSWGSGSPGAILERVAIGSSIVPDIDDWSTVRFIIVGARAGGVEATMSLEVNSMPVVTDREFGSAVLNRPTTAVAGAGGLVMCMNQGGPVATESWAQWHWKFGRFTPAGAELQSA